MKIIANINYYGEEYEVEDAQEYMKEQLVELFNFPVLLTAVNSNWRGETGLAEANNEDEVLDKVSSFESNEITLKHHKEEGYYFRLATHDRPMGFNVYIEEIEDE